MMMPTAPMTSNATSTSTPTGTPKPTATTTGSRRVPLDKRKRTETSCDKCKSRKQKCRKEYGQDACRYCILHSIECLTTQPRKKRLYGSVEGLGNRLALLEALVKGLLPEADVTDLDELRQLGSSLGISLPGSGEGEGSGERDSGSDKEGEDHASLLPDQQGQVQFIGPASSFAFHLKLRSLIGAGALRSFVLFGRNAADAEPIEPGDAPRNDPHRLSTAGALSRVDHSSPTVPHAQPHEVPSLESLIGAYFDHINPDFPVLYEASFREAYEGWLLDPGNADPAWLCSFLCVLLLSRRVARITFQEDQEKLWWRRVQTLLPVVMFTSSVMAVQALLLASLHLHNTNHRDACWNLTGTAVRIAFAIGLHQDKVNTMQTPLARELRKRLWWTLYAYEQMQVSSYDRPSAIEHPGSKISCLNERLIGSDLHNPPEYSQWNNRLVVHLGSACRAPKTVRANSSDESYVGPLSPAAGVLRDMERWRDLLPQHLRMEALESNPPAFQRPILMLHGLYHYTVIVLCRSALLTRANILSGEGKDAKNTALIAMADSCSDSGRSLARILLKLEGIGRFDAITWWDIWFALASSSVLVMDLVCMNKITGTDMSASRILLSQLADLAQRHKRNPHMPGTIQKFASIIPELQSMVNAMNTMNSPVTAIAKAETVNPTSHESSPRLPPQQTQEAVTYPFHHSATNSGAYMFADNMAGRIYPEQPYPGPAYSTARFDRNTQMSFMDFTINNIHDWNWGELGNLLGNEGVPNGHLPGQPPSGPMPPQL